MPHFRNGPEFSREEFRENICLRYGLMPRDIPVACNGCGKKFSVDHNLSWHWKDIILAQHDHAAKEWVTLGSWYLTPIAIYYKHLINSSTIQGERTGDGVRRG